MPNNEKILLGWEYNLGIEWRIQRDYLKNTTNKWPSYKFNLPIDIRWLYLRGHRWIQGLHLSNKNIPNEWGIINASAKICIIVSLLNSKSNCDKLIMVDYCTLWRIKVIAYKNME